MPAYASTGVQVAAAVTLHAMAHWDMEPSAPAVCVLLLCAAASGVAAQAANHKKTETYLTIITSLHGILHRARRPVRKKTGSKTANLGGPKAKRRALGRLAEVCRLRWPL